MTIELTMLVYAVLLTFAIIMVHASAAILQFGLMPLAGSRDDIGEPSVFVARAQRLSRNMQENLLLFAALVLAANAAGISNDMTVAGAQIFVAGRVAHAVIYLAGWPYVRPLAWGVAVIGGGMIALSLI
jgi:uncharacterized MAPEG superfamily protein